MITVALDAMGGDYGPEVVVPAAVNSLQRFPGLKIILVGKVVEVEQVLSSLDAKDFDKSRLHIHAASQVVGMDEKPSYALRGKRDSSMRVSINLVKFGQADACVSAGNTGALMATARFVLKMLPGIDRPAIVYSVPTISGHSVQMLDLGANVDCQPQHLYQFSVMGSILAQAVEEIERPRVALLNIGKEAIKGSELVRQTATLLDEAKKSNKLHYTGFVEGHDIFNDAADVIVCDGFVGNVALKTLEGTLKGFFKLIKEAFNQNIYTRLLGLLVRPLVNKHVKSRFDPNRHNGASLLGLRGVVIKSHGGATVPMLEQAIKVAMIEAKKNLPERIKNELASQSFPTVVGGKSESESEETVKSQTEAVEGIIA